MILFFCLIASLPIIIFNTPLRGVLDGLTTPIYIDTLYTFTNQEFARGSVYFNSGFDLPTNGTVYLGINGGMVNESINLNGGTIILTQPIVLEKFGKFSGSGFISGSADYSGIIKYTSGLFGGAGIGKIKFKSSMILQALSRIAGINEGSGILDLREMGNGSTLEINGGRVLMRQFLNNATSPSAVWFKSVDLVVGTQFAGFKMPTVYFEGTPSITVGKNLSIKKMALSPFTKLRVYPNSKIQFEQLSMPYAGTRLELRHSQLDCIGTTTGYTRMLEPFSHHLQGEISLDGKCSIGSSTNNILIFDRYAQLEIFPGARFTINSKNHFILE